MCDTCCTHCCDDDLHIMSFMFCTQNGIYMAQASSFKCILVKWKGSPTKRFLHGQDPQMPDDITKTLTNIII